MLESRAIESVDHEGASEMAEERGPGPPLALAALVPYPEGTTPSQRYRIEQWAPYLRETGISVDFFPFADEQLLELLHRPGRRLAKAVAGGFRFANRVADLLRVRDYDVVLVHRAMCIAGPALLERVLTLVGPPVIFDFDDAIFLRHTTEANRNIGWLKFAGKTATICRLSSTVVVGNSFLRDYALRHNPNVIVIPTSVDIDRMSKRSRQGKRGRVVIGWTGSSTSQTYLEMFVSVLHEVGKRDDVEIRVHSDREPVLPGVSFVWRPWSAETEVEEISAFDIGLMPMPDDEWARGKCAMKALLYMSLGIPTVCSPVGANREVIKHGVNGLLASSPSDWVAQLVSLVERPDLRERLGRAGRETVERTYSMRRSAGLFAQVVRETIRQGR